MENLGITQIQPEEKWKEYLMNNKVEHKASILLSVRRQYPNSVAAEAAGYTSEVLRNAVNVLLENGYHVDLSRGIILKA